jgi:Glycine cleavage system T protein (aminomethyltransferase)
MAKEPAYQPPHTSAHDQTPKPKKLRTTFGDKKIVATRSSRNGDDGYELSTPYDQVTMIFEDGSEKVVKSDDLYEPQ